MFASPVHGAHYLHHQGNQPSAKLTTSPLPTQPSHTEGEDAGDGGAQIRTRSGDSMHCGEAEEVASRKILTCSWPRVSIRLICL